MAGLVATLGTLITKIPMIISMARALKGTEKIENIIEKFGLEKRFGKSKAFKIARAALNVAKKFGFGRGAEEPLTGTEVNQLLSAEAAASDSGGARRKRRKRGKKGGADLASGAMFS